MTNQAVKKRLRGRPRSEVSERAILEATLELLAQGGFGAVTVDKVAALASVSKATIYRRWPSKENLVIAAFEQTQPLEVPASGTATRKLVRILWQLSHFMQDTPLGGVLHTLAAERQHNPELDEALAPLISARRQPVIEVIEAGIAKGEFHSGASAEFIADMCIGPIQLRAVMMHLPITKKYIEQVVKTACIPQHTN